MNKQEPDGQSLKVAGIYLRTRRSGVRVPPGAPLFSCSINHLARHRDCNRLTIFTDNTDNWLGKERRNLESESHARRQGLSPNVVLAYLFRILRGDVVVLVRQPELPNVLLGPRLCND